MGDPPTCKSFKTFDEQADKLIDRGLAASKHQLISRLKAVNYYRFTGYLHIFRETVIDNQGLRKKSDFYRNGTTLDLVWNYYLFDRRLRLLLLDAIERIEISLRTHIAYYWDESTKCANPQKYQSSFAPDFDKDRKDHKSGKIRPSRREEMLEIFQKAFNRSIDECVFHHREDLGFKNVQDIPIWVFTELSTIGELSRVFSGLKNNLKMTIAKNFGCSDIKFFDSLITLIHHARNTCAHHGRVWNRQWNQNHGTHNSPAVRATLKPIVKNTSLFDWNLQWNQTQWDIVPNNASAFSFPKTSTAFLLTVCKWFLKVSANTSIWDTRLIKLLKDKNTPSFAIKEMRFPDHWEEHPLWK